MRRGSKLYGDIKIRMITNRCDELPRNEIKTAGRSETVLASGPIEVTQVGIV